MTVTQQQVIELWGGIGLLGFLAVLVVLVQLRPSEEDTGAPVFVWVAGFVLFIAACTLLSSAGLVDFK